MIQLSSIIQQYQNCYGKGWNLNNCVKIKLIKLSNQHALKDPKTYLIKVSIVVLFCISSLVTTEMILLGPIWTKGLCGKRIWSITGILGRIPRKTPLLRKLTRFNLKFFLTKTMQKSGNLCLYYALFIAVD